MQSDEDDESSPTDSQEINISVKEIIQQFAERDEVGGSSNESYAQNVLSNLRATGTEECPICMDLMEEPMLLPACAHLWYVTFTAEFESRQWILK